MARGGARPGSGRKRKSPDLKLVTGTYRPDRDQASAVDTAEAPVGPMIAPADLSERELVHFADVVKMLEAEKRPSPHYVPVVTLLARRMAEVERLSAVVEVVGDTYETETAGGSIMYRARPEVAMRSEAMRHAQSLLSELMLSPVAALKIASGHKKEPGAFDEF